jgi:uracil-DNA glycosylase
VNDATPADTSPLPPDRDAWPDLDPRHNAMLADMGVAVWWASAKALRPAQAATAQVPGQTARPVTAPAAALPPTSSEAPQPQKAPPVPVIQAPHHPVTRIEPAPQTDLDAIAEAVRACTLCGLAQRRQQAVPGVGDPSPDWLIVGEAPGEEEDRQGLPFVGRAGQLLDRMLAAMGLTRAEKVYITNVIKCRPPQNRNPEAGEIAQCTPYLLRQVALLQPRVIVAMGRFAAQTVLGEGGAYAPEALKTLPLGKLRGQVHQVQLGGLTLPVVVTYHPAYLLRSPAEKARSWADLCLALETMATTLKRA